VSLVFVGPAPDPVDELLSLPNVHLLGTRPHAQIPAYGSAFDVALMPWRDNEWIRFANPIKLKEYLALGLPVVSTDFPEVRRYAHLVRVARDRRAFIDAVARTLADGGPADPARRRAAVEHATWDAAAELLLTESEGANRRRRA
jgi:glycosyltransferase involved in cell wall biosynthesis